jgi:hypothetical protein
MENAANSSMQRMSVAVLRLITVARLNDQRLSLDWPAMATTAVPFSKEEHKPLDGICKEGALCVVLFPALREGDMVRVKAAVLPQDYSLD